MRYSRHSGFARDDKVKIRESDGTYTEGTVVAILVESTGKTMIVAQGGFQRQVWLEQVSRPD